MKKLLVGSVALIALTAAGAANAGMPTKAVPSSNEIISVNNQFAVDFAGTHVDYMERDTGGAPLDSETGWVPGVAVSASLMRDWGVHNLYLYGQYTWTTGHTAYVGSTGGPYGSFTNTDGADLSNADIRIGEGFDFPHDMMLTPYFGLGWHDWARNLPGSSGYHEDYSNWYAGAGLMFQVVPAPRWVLSANGLVGSTFDASMVTSLIPGGYPITPQTYNLGSSAIFMAGFAADYAITQAIHVNFGVDYVGFGYGKSPASKIDGSLEPDSKTSYVIAKVGLGIAIP
jgi:hypothetical protein